MIAAIVLAAGASSRMGRPRRRCRLASGGDTVLSRGVASLLAAGVPQSRRRRRRARGGRSRALLGRAIQRLRIVEHAGWREDSCRLSSCGLDAVDQPHARGRAHDARRRAARLARHDATADTRVARDRCAHRAARAGRDARTSRALRSPRLRRAPRGRPATGRQARGARVRPSARTCPSPTRARSWTSIPPRITSAPWR